MTTDNRQNPFSGVDCRQVIERMSVGFWTIELAQGHAPRMWGDATMGRIMGAEACTSPEALYEFWFGRIDPNFVGSVLKAVEQTQIHKNCEIRYPWLHPELGWRIVRCGASVDESAPEGVVRLQGFHKDVSEHAEIDVRADERFHIADLKKLRRYLPYFMELCEELYEIDPKTFGVSAVFFRRDRYPQIPDGTPVEEFATSRIYPEDIPSVRRQFDRDKIASLPAGASPRSVEVRASTVTGEWRWVELRLITVADGESVRHLALTFDIEQKKRAALLAVERNAILDAFTNLYRSILEVNLSTGTVNVLKHTARRYGSDAPETFTLSDFARFVANMAEAEVDRREIFEFFDEANLRRLCGSRRTDHVDFRAVDDCGAMRWVRAQALYEPRRSDRFFLVFSNIDRERVFHSIAEKFVFKNCDYFYCVDLRQNRFERFSGAAEPDSDLPPEQGDDYRGQMVEYITSRVVDADVNLVLDAVDPQSIIRRLDSEGEYTITYGLNTPNGLRRKHVVFRYYDAENKIALIRRSDVTEEYERRLAEKRRMADFEREAMIDGLTGAYNRQGGVRLIRRVLDETDTINALCVLDLDHFKRINDTYGHIRGDEALRDCGEKLRSLLRAGDVVVRLGGDEFIVFLKDIRSEENARQCVESLVRRLYNPEGHGPGEPMSVSIGAAMSRGRGESFESLYRAADSALYLVKSEGRNGYAFAGDTSRIAAS